MPGCGKKSAIISISNSQLLERGSQSSACSRLLVGKWPAPGLGAETTITLPERGGKKRDHQGSPPSVVALYPGQPRFSSSFSLEKQSLGSRSGSIRSRSSGNGICCVCVCQVLKSSAGHCVSHRFAELVCEPHSTLDRGSKS